ncbi:MAG: VOC family protein [Pseudonocardiaceae bacterium]
MLAVTASIPERVDSYSALIDPDGHGPRLFFQRVPEGKTAKNRVHLDVDVGAGSADDEQRRAVVRERARQLVAAGASLLREVDEPHGWCVTLTDPEGNEFCVQ